MRGLRTGEDRGDDLVAQGDRRRWCARPGLGWASLTVGWPEGSPPSGPPNPDRYTQAPRPGRTSGLYDLKE